MFTKALNKKPEDEEVFLDAQEAQLHPDAHPDGGLGCSDLQLLERQRGAIMEVIKTLGKNLITGMSICFSFLCSVFSCLFSDLMGGLRAADSGSNGTCTFMCSSNTPQLFHFYFVQATLIS